MNVKSILKIAGSLAGLAYVADLRNSCKEIYDAKIEEHFSTSGNKTEDTDDLSTLRKDSVNALTGLGYKVKDSKEKVEDAITNGNCKSVQDIIRYALTNGSKYS